MITATFDFMGKKYVGEGQDKESAIANIPYKGFARAKALLTVGEKTIIMSPMQTQRLFAPNPTIRACNVKSISLRF
jgi:hypothetical protein